MTDARSVTPIRVVGAAIVQGARCLVTQRGPAMSLAGKWEFPGGKIEAEELAPAALAREVFEELGLVIEVGELLGTGRAAVGTKLVTLDVYAATVTGGTLALSEHAQMTWATAEDLPHFDWAEADVPSVPKVIEWLRRELILPP